MGRTILRTAVILGLGLTILGVTGVMERLFYHPRSEATPPPQQFAGSEMVRFTSADGTQLSGWFIPSQIGDSVDAATILHTHGNAGNIAGHLWFSEFLPPAGFNVMLIDYRGYGESEGSPWRRAPLIQDAQAALDTLLARHDIDPDRIGLYGNSLGGAIGLNLTATNDAIRAAAIEASFDSWRTVAANSVGGDPPNWLARVLARILIRDHARPDDAVTQIDRPLLLMHGTADTIVPVSHVHRLAAGATHADVQIFEGGGHVDLRISHPEIESIVIEFFRTHLSKPSDTSTTGGTDGQREPAGPSQLRS